MCCWHARNLLQEGCLQCLHMDLQLRVFVIKAAKSGSAMRGGGNALSLVPEPDLDIRSAAIRLETCGT